MLQKCENIDKLLRSLSKKNDLLSKDIKKAFDGQKRNTCKKSIQLVEYFKQQQNRRDHNVEFQQRNFSNPLVSRKILPFSSPVNCQIQQANCLRSGFRNTLDQAQRDQEYLGSYAQLEFTIRELKKYIFDKQQKICILEAQVQKLHLQLAVKEKLLDKIQSQNSKMQRQRNLSLTNISELDYKIVSSRLVDIQSHFLHEQLIHFLQELKQRLNSDIFSSFQEAQSQRWKHILAKSTHKFNLQQSLSKYQNTKNKQSGLLKVVQDKVQHLKSFFCNKLEEYLRELHQQIIKQQSMLSPAQSSINLSIKTIDRCSNQKQTYEVAPFQLSSKSWLQNRPVCQNSIIIVAEGDEENGEAPADSTSKISENSSQAFMRSLKSLLQDYSYLDPPIREKQ